MFRITITISETENKVDVRGKVETGTSTDPELYWGDRVVKVLGIFLRACGREWGERELEAKELEENQMSWVQ